MGQDAAFESCMAAIAELLGEYPTGYVPRDWSEFEPADCDETESD